MSPKQIKKITSLDRPVESYELAIKTFIPFKNILISPILYKYIIPKAKYYPYFLGFSQDDPRRPRTRPQLEHVLIDLDEHSNHIDYAISFASYVYFRPNHTIGRVYGWSFRVLPKFQEILANCE